MVPSDTHNPISPLVPIVDPHQMMAEIPQLRQIQDLVLARMLGHGTPFGKPKKPVRRRHDWTLRSSRATVRPVASKEASSVSQAGRVRQHSPGHYCLLDSRSEQNSHPISRPSRNRHRSRDSAPGRAADHGSPRTLRNALLSASGSPSSLSGSGSPRGEGRETRPSAIRRSSAVSAPAGRARLTRRRRHLNAHRSSPIRHQLPIVDLLRCFTGHTIRAELASDLKTLRCGGFAVVETTEQPRTRANCLPARASVSGHFRPCSLAFAVL
jgi:hypothetical protein